jgi:hypothetical protein
MTNLGEVTENTTGVLAIDFLDEDALPVIPTGGLYRISSTTGEVVKTDTAFTPSASQHKITLLPNDNRMLTTNKAVENRIIVITFQYGTGKQGAGEYKYSVRRLEI